MQPPAYFRRNAVLDRVFGVLLLLPGLPIIACLVLLVRLTSRGPGIYHQVRLGQHGRRFTIYKIRTMRHQAEADCGAVWTEAGDPRITCVGGVLRKFHLDELPQLLNVLKGEMSLIGPRPERPEFVHVLAEAIPGYLKRFAVRPAVTGLAQLNLPPDTDLDSVPARPGRQMVVARIGRPFNRPATRVHLPQHPVRVSCLAAGGLGGRGDPWG